VNKKTADIRRVEVTQEYEVIRCTTYKDILALGWEQARILYIYDPLDKEVYFVDAIYDWIQVNKRFHNRQVLLIESPTGNTKVTYSRS